MLFLKKTFAFVRILCDGDGKLNEKSVLIDFPELSYKIYLDLSEVLYFSLKFSKIGLFYFNLFIDRKRGAISFTMRRRGGRLCRRRHGQKETSCGKNLHRFSSIFNEKFIERKIT